MKLGFLLLAVHSAWGGLGVDLSVYSNSFLCFKTAGYDLALIRGYRNTGTIDPNLVSNLRNANDAQIPIVEVYMFPCVPCGDPEGQVDSLISALSGETYQRIWLDVELYQWNSDKNTNRQFILDIDNRMRSYGEDMGIYTNYFAWDYIVGNDWVELKERKLWYAHYDNDPNFDDFRPFAGWTQPDIKQYQGNTSLCGVSVGLNYHE